MNNGRQKIDRFFRIPNSLFVIRNSPSGFSIIEALVSIALVGAMIISFGSLLSAVNLHKRSRGIVMATALAEETLEATRNLTSSEITNRTDAAPIGITLNRGGWEVAATSTAPSPARALAAARAETAVAGITSLLMLPADVQGDGNLKAGIMVPPGSAIGWRAGLAFRGRDIENLYRYTFGATTVSLERIQNGTATTIWSQTLPSTLGTWYILEVIATGASIELKRNGATLATVTDTTFRQGDMSLIAQGGALPWFDDVSATGLNAESFDDEPTGSVPVGWRRLSPGDLKNGAALITIEDVFSGQTFKKITSRVSWQGPRGPEQVIIITYRR